MEIHNTGETGSPQIPDTKAQEIRQDELFPGYPQHPSSEDVYNEHMVESADDPEDEQAPNPSNEKVTPSGKHHDLDIPGVELDDAGEVNGEEDEENNFYSIGGDNHSGLEENQGELFETEPE